MIRFIKYWLPVIFFSLLILSFSSLPGKNIPNLFSCQAVIFHLFEYLIFAFLLSRAIKAYYPSQTKSGRFLMVFFLVLVYGMIDEFYQSFIPNRTPDLFDIMIDGTGGFLGGLFYGMIKVKSIL